MLSHALIHECQTLAHNNCHSFKELTPQDENHLGKAILSDPGLSTYFRGQLIEAALHKSNARCREHFLELLCNCKSWGQFLTDLTQDNGNTFEELNIAVAELFKDFIDDELQALE